MRKMHILMIVLLALIPCTAFAREAGELEGFILDEKYVMSGMDKSWYQGYEPSAEGGSLTICLPVASKSSNGKLTATLLMDDEEIAPIRTQKRSAIFWRNEGMFEVKLSFKLTGSRINGDYTGRVLLEGDNKDGRHMTSEYPVVIRIRDGQDADVYPEITDVQGELKVGEEGTITAEVTNPSRYAALTDVMLTVTDASGGVIPAGSDTLRLGRLSPGGKMEIAYPVSVKPDAAVALHELTFRLTYAAAGKDEEWEENFTLPVSQQMRLEQGGVQMATTAVQGDIASITLPLMNMGRGDIVNVMATLAIPGVVERQSVLVGTIAPGETKQAKLSFTPGKGVLGDVSGTLAVTAEDAWGNESGFTLPVGLTIEEPVRLTAVGEKAEEDEEPPYMIYALAGACALMLIGLILQGMILRRKIRKLEEDRL